MQIWKCHWQIWKQIWKQSRNDCYDNKCKLLQSWFRTAVHNKKESNKTNQTVKYFRLMNSKYVSNNNYNECE